MFCITIKPLKEAFREVFTFPMESDTDAWYGLDGHIAQQDGAELRLNADREVYAIYTAPDGTMKYGTVGDEENDNLADNYPIEDGEVYYFYENPRTKDYYI